MKLIFRVAAGTIIGLLIYQIYGLKLMDVENEKLEDSLSKAAQLKIGATRILNMVHEYYQEHRQLPESLEELACQKSDPCDYRKHGDQFYAFFGDDWIAVEPIVVYDKTDFSCTTSVLQLYDPRYDKCTQLNKDDLPKFE